MRSRSKLFAKILSKQQKWSLEDTEIRDITINDIMQKSQLPEVWIIYEKISLTSLHSARKSILIKAALYSLIFIAIIETDWYRETYIFHVWPASTTDYNYINWVEFRPGWDWL